MTCRRALALLPLHVGNDLPEVDSRRVRDHLAGCKSCRPREEALLESQAFLRSAREPEADEAFHAGIRREVWRRIREGEAAPRSPFRLLALSWPRTAALAAALLLGVPLLVLVIVPRTSPLVETASKSPAPARRTPKPEAPPPVVARVLPVPSPVPAEPVRVAARSRHSRRERSTVGAARSTALAAVRIEMQTPDPNVRIIWLTGPPPEPPAEPSRTDD